MIAAFEQEGQVQHAHAGYEIRHRAVGRDDDIDRPQQKALEHGLLATQLHRRIYRHINPATRPFPNDARHLQQALVIGLVDIGGVRGAEDNIAVRWREIGRARGDEHAAGRGERQAVK